MQPVALQQRVELAQVRAQVLRRHGRVLPAAVRGLLKAHPGQARAVGPDLPELRGADGVVDDPAFGRRGALDDRLGPGADLGGVVADDLEEHPAVPRGQHADGVGPVLRHHHIDDAAVEALARRGAEVEQVGDVITGVRHGGVAQRDHQPVRRIRDEPHGGADDHAQGSLGAREELRRVEPALGQQVLERVPRDLADEGAELGADHPEVGGHERAELGQVVDAQRDQLAVAIDDVEADHVVGHAPVAERARAARVVADHAADRASRRRRRVGPQPQPEWAAGDLQLLLHDAGVDDGGAGLLVDGMDPVEVPRDVDHQPGADGIARARGARAARGDRHPDPQGGAHDGDQLVGGPGAGDGDGLDPVERGVAGVERAGQRRGVDDLRQAPQLGQQGEVGGEGRAIHGA